MENILNKLWYLFFWKEKKIEIRKGKIIYIYIYINFEKRAIFKKNSQFILQLHRRALLPLYVFSPPAAQSFAPPNAATNRRPASGRLRSAVVPPLLFSRRVSSGFNCFGKLCGFLSKIFVANWILEWFGWYFITFDFRLKFWCASLIFGSFLLDK